MKATRTCSIEDCERDARKRGMCDTCYARLRRRGEIEQLLPVRSIAERLAAGLERKPNGCLEWTGALDSHGYGQITVGKRDEGKIGTHRLAWGLAHPDEPLPPVVRHFVCDNPPCCDPEHLRPGTIAENIADKVAKGRAYGWKSTVTHCPQGHPYDEANTYVDKNGGRACRKCRLATNARYVATHQSPTVKESS